MSGGKTSARRLGPNATRVALVTSVAIVLLGTLLAIGTTRSDTYELRATFDDVRGLIDGGQVRAGAIKVGQVRDVFLNRDGYPEAVMEVDNDFRVHEGAVANLRLGSNAGVVNRVIELTQGDTSARTLPEGATLARGQTDQPVNLDEAAETLNPRNRENIRRFLARLDDATRGRDRDIARTLRHSPTALNESANLLAQANRDGAALRTMVREGARAVSALASSPQDVGAAVDRTAELLRATARRHEDLRASVELLGPTLVRARRLLTSLEQATPSLTTLAEGLGPLLDELGPVVHMTPRLRRAAGPLLQAVERLVAEAPNTLRKVRPIIDAAFPVGDTVVPLARSALPLVSTMRAYVPEVSGAFQNINSAAGGYNKAGHVIRAFASFGPGPSTFGNEIDGSDCGPGLLKTPFIRVPGVAECEPWTDFEKSALTAPEDGG